MEEARSIPLPLNKFTIWPRPKVSEDTIMAVFRLSFSIALNSSPRKITSSRNPTQHMLMKYSSAPGYPYCNFIPLQKAVDATVASDDEYDMPLTLSTVVDEDGNLKDMLYATANVTNATADQGPVNFTFSHLLSKAQFTVTSNAQGGYHHTVTGIKVSNFETATYTIANGTWSGTTAKDINFGEVAEVTEASGEKTNATQMLLVPNAATFNVTFTVELIHPVAVEKGTKFSIREGGRTIGAGNVVDIIE